MNILVTGGAGYIGSVVTEQCISAGHNTAVVDNLVKGHQWMVDKRAAFYNLDLTDTAAVARVLRENEVAAVIHMAAYSLVAESMQDPARYYHNNVVSGLSLLDAMSAEGVKKIIFSSTAAVYGEPEKQPIGETDALRPTNTYGETKLAFEHMLKWFDQAYGLRYASLRYFNAAGASRNCGELHNPETHLIPIVLDAARGSRPYVEIYGDDYPTNDGTCVRDYIHVEDLAKAHLLALDGLETESRIYNLGSGGGYSVKEVIDTAARVCGREIPVRTVARRAGDPAVLIASSDKIKHDLGWRPEKEDLDTIITSAWDWGNRYLDKADALGSGK